MLYIYGLTGQWSPDAAATLQSVKAMTTHIKWVASSTRDSPVQLRLPFKASKHTLKGAFKWLSSGQVLLPTAVRTLHWATALGGRVNDVGSTAWERALATGFQVGAHGYAGQASSRSSGSSNRCGSRRLVDAPLSDCCARYMEHIVAGPQSREAVNGQRTVLLLWRRCVPGGRPGLQVGSNGVTSQQQMWSSTCR